MLDEGLTDDINGSVSTAEQTFSIKFSKEKTKFCLSLHYNHDNSFCFLTNKKSMTLKPIIKC